MRPHPCVTRVLTTTRATEVGHDQARPNEIDFIAGKRAAQIGVGQVTVTLLTL
jgi:hypothetical protein